MGPSGLMGSSVSNPSNAYGMGVSGAYSGAYLHNPYPSNSSSSHPSMSASETPTPKDRKNNKKNNKNAPLPNTASAPRPNGNYSAASNHSPAAVVVASPHIASPQIAPPAPLQRNPNTVAHFANFSIHEVLRWLKSLPLPSEVVDILVSAFEKNRITGNVLVDLKEKDLEDELGIDKLGPRRLFSIHLEEALCK